MMLRVKQVALNGLVLLSLLLVGLVCLGYVGNISIDAVNHPGGTSAAWAVALQADRGRVSLYRETANPGSSGTPIGFHIIPRARFLPLRPPDLKRSIWEFDAHNLLSPTPGTGRFLLACPIWCACVPLLIAPSIWLVNWRRKRTRDRAKVEGFSVVQG
jgi:hypothetical protein